MIINNPKVSVGITVKNGEKYIAQAIESILEQEFPAHEILIADDFSTDKTVKIARSYPEVKIIERERTGIGNGWNSTIKNASGNLISFLTHDDLWTKEKLKLQVEFLKNNPQIMYVIGHFEYFLEDKNYIPPGFRTELLGKEPIALTPHSILARKEVFEKVGFFDEGLSTGEDLDWFSRAKDLEIPYSIIPKVLLRVRVHQTNTSLHAKENNQNMLQIIKDSIERKKRIARSVSKNDR